MNTINFDEIENGSNNGGTERKTVSPGVDIFTIEEGEVKNNTNGKEFLALKFVNKDGKYLREQFYTTTPGALKRVKELASNAGVSLTQATAEQVVAKLIGTKVGLIVGADKELADIDGNQVIVTRSRLKNPYNFSFKPDELEKWKDSKIVIEDKTVGVPQEVTQNTSKVTDDLPF